MTVVEFMLLLPLPGVLLYGISTTCMPDTQNLYNRSVWLHSDIFKQCPCCKRSRDKTPRDVVRVAVCISFICLTVHCN